MALMSILECANEDGVELDSDSDSEAEGVEIQ
jgi:hypothetical protein